MATVNGWGMMNRHPLLGIEFPPWAYQVLWRLAGVDQLHVNGIANKFWEATILSCVRLWRAEAAV
jgi:ribulose-bisphosphate carboxylase large chain